MNSGVPSLTRVCVNKIVSEIELFCRGVDFEELGDYPQILGPFENLCMSLSLLENTAWAVYFTLLFLFSPLLQLPHAFNPSSTM